MKNESQGVDSPSCSYQRDLYMRVCECRLLKENHIPVAARDSCNDQMERGSSGCFGSNIYNSLHGRYPEMRSSQDENLKKQLAGKEKGSGSFCHDFRAGKFIEGSGCSYDPFGVTYDGNDEFPRGGQMQERNSSDKEDHMLQDSFIQLRAGGGTLLPASTSNTHASVANLGNQAALSIDASAICHPGKGCSTNRTPHRRPLDPRLKVALTQKEPHKYTSSKMDNSAPSFKHVIPASSKTEANLMNAPNLIPSIESVKLSDISSLPAKMFEASKQNMRLPSLFYDSLAASHPFAGLVDKEQKRFQEHGGKGKVVKSSNCQGDSVHEEKQDKNPRAKKFKVSLAEMVVELLKPAWQEGHMSREEHKGLAKRIVDKVMRALQGTSIPTNEKHIEQYLAVSKPRIAKLVEEYVEYQKACKS
ncbi:unnamed protein product [Victoria cruziana]